MVADLQEIAAVGQQYEAALTLDHPVCVPTSGTAIMVMVMTWSRNGEERRENLCNLCQPVCACLSKLLLLLLIIHGPTVPATQHVGRCFRMG